MRKTRESLKERIFLKVLYKTSSKEDLVPLQQLSYNLLVNHNYADKPSWCFLNSAVNITLKTII